MFIWIIPIPSYLTCSSSIRESSRWTSYSRNKRQLFDDVTHTRITNSELFKEKSFREIFIHFSYRVKVAHLLENVNKTILDSTRQKNLLQKKTNFYLHAYFPLIHWCKKLQNERNYLEKSTLFFLLYQRFFRFDVR